MYPIASREHFRRFFKPHPQFIHRIIPHAIELALAISESRIVNLINLRKNDIPGLRERILILTPVADSEIFFQQCDHAINAALVTAARNSQPPVSSKQTETVLFQHLLPVMVFTYIIQGIRHTVSDKHIAFAQGFAHLIGRNNR